MRLTKRDACTTACTYTIENYMAIMEKNDDGENLLNNKPGTYQLDDKEPDDNDNNDDIPDDSPQVRIRQMRI